MPISASPPPVSFRSRPMPPLTSPEVVQLECALGKESNQREIASLLGDLDAKIANERKQNSFLESTIVLLQSQINALQQQTESTSHSCVESNCQADLLQQQLNDKSHQLQELSQSHSKKVTECDQLSMEVDRLTEKANSSWSSFVQCNEALSETRAKLFSTNVTVASHEQQIQNLTTNLQIQQTEAETVAAAFASFRKSKTALLVELEGKVEFATERESQLQSRLLHQSKTIDDLEGRCAVLQRSLSDANLDGLQQEESFKRELFSATRLAELYKQGVEESSRHLDELEKMHQESEQVLKKQCEKLDKTVSNLTAEKQKLQDCLSQRETDIENLQRLIEQAAFNGDQPASKRSKSVTQVYAENLRLQQQILEERHNCERLQSTLDGSLKDLTAQAPLIQRQAMELQETQQEVARLIVESATTSTQLEESRRALKEAEILVQQKNREVRLRDQSIADLGRQIQVLLAQSQEASLQSGSLTSELIVDVHSIAELQERNQKLLAVVRELTDQLEGLSKKFENQSQDEHSAYLRKQLEETVVQIEALRESRQKQTELLEKLSAVHSAPAISASDSSHKELEQYRKESNLLVQQLNEQLDRLKEECSTLRIESFRSSSQADILKERCESLIKANANSSSELKRVSEKELNTQRLLQDAQQRMQIINEESTQARLELQRQISRAGQLQSDNEVVKMALSTARQECTQFQMEKERLSTLLDNLQLVQSQFIREDSDARKKIVVQLQESSEELAQVRRKLAIEMDYNKSLMHNVEKERSESAKRLLEYTESKNAALHNLSLVEAKNEELHSRLEILTIQLASSENRANQLLLRGSPEDTSISSSCSAVTDFTATIRRQHEELRLLKSHIEEYRALLASKESALSEANEQLRDGRVQLGRLSDIKANEVVSLQQQLAKSQESCNQLQSQLNDLAHRNKSLEQELQERLEKAEKFDSLVEQNHSLTELHQSQLQQLQVQIDANRNRYEQTIIAHASDLQALALAKEQVSSLTKERQEIILKLEVLQFEKSQFENAKSSEKKVLEEKVQNLEIRLTDLSRQNDLLLNRFELVKSEVQSEDLDKFQVEETIAYLRREKEIIACQCDIAEQENKRLSNSMASLTARLQAVEHQLLSEQRLREQDLAMIQDHQRLEARANEASILRESNNSLRMECDGLRTQFTSLEGHAAQIQAQLNTAQDDHLNCRAQLEAQKQEIAALITENKQWRSRLNQAISSSKLIDEETHASVKEENSNLEKRLEESKLAAAVLQREFEEVKSKLEVSDARYKQIYKHCQELRKKTIEIPTTPVAEASNEKLAQLEEQLKVLQEKFAEVEGESQQKDKKINALTQRMGLLKQQFEHSETQHKFSITEQEKQLADLKKEHELRTVLLNSQWESKLRKQQSTPGSEVTTPTSTETPLLQATVTTEAPPIPDQNIKSSIDQTQFEQNSADENLISQDEEAYEEALHSLSENEEYHQTAGEEIQLGSEEELFAVSEPEHEPDQPHYPQPDQISPSILETVKETENEVKKIIRLSGLTSRSETSAAPSTTSRMIRTTTQGASEPSPAAAPSNQTATSTRSGRRSTVGKVRGSRSGKRSGKWAQ